MKKLICLALLPVLLLCLLCGCGKENTLRFYYCSQDYLESNTGSVLAPEKRDVTGYRDDPQFLVSLYLAGPLDRELLLPFPAGTSLQSMLISGNQITIQLYPLPQPISDSEFSLACACLTMTCLEFTDAQSVTVLCGNRSVTLDQSMITITDTPQPTNTTNGGAQ